jgi:hypothetical protein
MYFEALSGGMLSSSDGKFKTQRISKMTPSNELTVPWKKSSVQWPDEVVHCMKTQVSIDNWMN